MEGWRCFWVLVCIHSAMHSTGSSYLFLIHNCIHTALIALQDPQRLEPLKELTILLRLFEQ